MKHEFDNYAADYRLEQTKYLGPTGENSEYFAQLKAQRLYAWVTKHLFYTPKKILDFGCGDGIMTFESQKLFPQTQLYGVDPSSESIDLAIKAPSSVKFYISGKTIPYFEDNMFDVVYCAGVFHHIPYSEHADYIEELSRVLRPGGLLILFELNPLNPGTQYIFNGHPMEVNAKMLTPWYAKKITEKLQYKETVFYCFFPKFLQFLRPIERWFIRIPFGGLYGTIAQKAHDTRTEFDGYIKDYRDNLTKHCSLTGESSEYFITLKANNLKVWLENYGVTEPASILDFGCGDGAMAHEVKKIFSHASVHGVDPSSESIDYAQSHYPSSTFAVSSETIPYENNSFELIYTAGVLHHIPFEEHAHYVSECMRVLKPGGYLIIFELNPLNPGTRYIFKRNPIDKNATMLFHWYTKKIIKNLQYKETIFYCFFPKFLQFLRPLERWLTRVPCGGLYGTIVHKKP